MGQAGRRHKLVEIYEVPKGLEYITTDIANEFCDKSHYKDAEFDKQRWQGFMHTFTHDPSRKCLVAIIDMEICGFCLINREHEFTKKPILQIYTIYTNSLSRGTLAGRQMVGKSEEIGRQWGCKFSQVYVCPGFNDNMSVNSFKKMGYYTVGSIMRRDL